MLTIAAGEAVLDYGLYPRTSINQRHVSMLTEALRAGAEFPAILIDRETRRVIDGFHRVEAMKRAKGEMAAIAAEDRTFADETEMFLEAIRANTGHGMNLTQYDLAKATIRLQELQVDPDRIAYAFRVQHVSVGRLEARKTATANGKVVAIKGTASHLRGKPLTSRQEEANRRSGGQTVIFYANQLLNALNGDLVDTSNPIVLARLAELQSLLNELLAVREVLAA